MSEEIQRGLQLPSSTPSHTRRVRPKPFQRPSVNTGPPSDEPREWGVVAVTAVRVGDIVPEIGVITEVIESASAPPTGSQLTPEQIAEQVSWTVTLKGGVSHPNQRTYLGSDTVFAFTRISQAGDTTDPEGER